MKNFEKIKHFIQNTVLMSEEDFEKIIPFFGAKKVKRKTEILSIGDVSKEFFFINTGCLFTYSVDALGKEHIFRFAFENSWMGAPESFFNNTPSNYAIVSNDDSDLLFINVENLEKLFIAVPIMERFFRKLCEQHLLMVIKMYNSMVCESAKLRYNKLLRNQPELFSRVQLQHIASLLGVTPESLSRIRNKLSKK